MEAPQKVTSRNKLQLGSGVGLVAANMIGAGVFLSAGFMAQELAPVPILLAWVVGALIALAGCQAYAGVARLVPRSGGEYRFLSDLVHPFLGYLAGWASLLVGFAGPIAIDAVAAGSFLQRVWPATPPLLTGALVIIGLTAFHAVDFNVSKHAQNGLVAVKIALVVCFVGFGLALGNHALPDWGARSSDGSTGQAFASSLFYIAFAFSGWNAAIYAADEFARPERDVPRSMLIGCAGVATLYLLVNWVLVANITPDSARVVFEYDAQRVTLAHVVASDLFGETAAKVVSAAMALALISAASAMTFVGPRVYAAMARDGYLPRALAGSADRPPLGSVLLQGSVALLILVTHSLQQILQNVGAILTIFSALTAAALFKARFLDRRSPRPPTHRLVAAGLYVLAAGWMVYFGVRLSPTFWLWTGPFVVLAAVGYGAAVYTRRKPAARAQPR